MFPVYIIRLLELLSFEVKSVSSVEDQCVVTLIDMSILRINVL